MKLPLIIATLFAGLALAGCNGADTYYDLRNGTIYEPYGTQHDCRIASEKYGAQNVWRGLVGGLQSWGDNTRNISREACFPNRAECEYWSAQMSGALVRIYTNSCKPGYRQ